MAVVMSVKSLSGLAERDHFHVGAGMVDTVSGSDSDAVSAVPTAVVSGEMVTLPGSSALVTLIVSVRVASAEVLGKPEESSPSVTR